MRRARSPARNPRSSMRPPLSAPGSPLICHRSRQMETSLLDYARFHGIASDFIAYDPLEQVDQTLTIETSNELLLQNIQPVRANRLHEARHTLHERLLGEKLNIPKESAPFLALVVRRAQAQNLNFDWDDILPAFNRIDDSKFEPLIFPMEYESDVELSRSPLRYTPGEMNLQGPAGSYDTAVVANPLDSLRSNKSSLVEQVRKEKLKCTRESFSIIQSIRGSYGLSGDEIEDALRSLLKRNPVEIESSILRPLCDNHFPPPSPTPVSDEHMLPSPISSDFINLSLDCDHPHELRPEDTLFSSSPGRSSSCCGPDRENQHPGMGIVEKKDSTKTSNDRYYQAQDIPAPIPGYIDLSVDKRSSHLHEGDITIHANNSDLPTSVKSGHEISITQYFSLPVPEDARVSIEQHTVTKKCQQQRPRSSFRNEAFHKGPQLAYVEENCGSQSGSLPINPNTAMSKQCPPQTIEEPPPGQPHKPQGMPVSTVVSNHQRSASKLPRITLDSLSSFMETRGRGRRRQIPAKSSYFAESEDGHNPVQPKSITTACMPKHQLEPDISTFKSVPNYLSPETHIPRVPTHHEGLVLFISTVLLKTHIRLIQYLEGAEHPPRLIYRDYATSASKSQPKPQPQPNGTISQHQQTAVLLVPLPEEADIILSPKTGIILTTSQATRQLYLPGHRPTSIQSNGPGPRNINSPLREQIFRLSSRYEQVYIFISHGAEQSMNSRCSNPQFIADKHTLASLISLVGFCNSMSDYATLTPLLIPSTPETAARWVLALAHKYACQLPPPRTQSRHSNAFTSVNPKPQLGSLLGSMEESAWELFLRRMGLNPYAGQTILAVFRRETGDVLNNDKYYESGFQGNGVRYLSRFVEMSPEEREALFIGLLGEKTLKRFHSLIERDWQCDWTLNFDNTVK